MDDSQGGSGFDTDVLKTPLTAFLAPDDRYLCDTRQVGQGRILCGPADLNLYANRTVKHFQHKAETTSDQAVKEQVQTVIEKVGDNQRSLAGLTKICS